MIDWERNGHASCSMLDVIGQTPLIRLWRVADDDITTTLCGDEDTCGVPDREHPLDDGSVRSLDRHQARLEVVS